MPHGYVFDPCGEPPLLRLSVKTYHAINCLTELAGAQRDKQLLSVSTLSQKNGISLSLLEQIFLQLRKSGYLTSVRGARGGYHLAQPASQIKVLDVIDALEGKVYFQRCKGQRNCANQQVCRTHHFFEALDQTWRAQLAHLTLHELVVRERCTLSPRGITQTCIR